MFLLWCSFSLAAAVAAEIVPNELPPLVFPFSSAQAKDAQESLAQSLGYPVMETNALGMELVLIPPGTFTMGSQTTEKARADDEDPVEVTLTKPFWLGKTEVTQGQWEHVMGTSPWKGEKYVNEDPKNAVSWVSWKIAQQFVESLSNREGVTYRLPTEAEWEWSCRAGTSSSFSIGENEAVSTHHRWYWPFCGSGTGKRELYAHPVGGTPANPFGLNDMHGNVYEWCADSYFDKLPGGTNPLVMTVSDFRVVRGGSWSYNPQDCSSADRGRLKLDYRCGVTGFRVLRTQ